MTKGVSLAKEVDPNRKDEFATVDVSESLWLCKKLSMVAMSDPGTRS